MKIKDFTSIYEGKFSLENVENGKGFYLFERRIKTFKCLIKYE